MSARAWLSSGRFAAIAVVALVQAVGMSGAKAHHGYEWLDPEPFVLEGVVEDIYLGFPHGFMMVDAADGEWIVELSDPPAHERAGFTADSVNAGDAVRVIGRRALDPRERRVRGDRIEIGEATYDIFPAAIFTPVAFGTGFYGWLLELQNWSVARSLRSASLAYPIVNAAHILGIALLIGAIVPLDLRLLGAFGAMPPGELARVLVPVSVAGLVLAVGAGFLLFAVQPLEYAENAAFLTKVSLVAVGAIHATALRYTGAWRRAMDGGAVAPWLKVAALVSALVWISALVAGRMIAFVG